ncbi:MAG: hypothetical protein ACREFF_07835 [Candidatus Udaeobacter sp.]
MKSKLAALVLLSASTAFSESIFVGRIISIVPDEGALVSVDRSMDGIYGPVAAPDASSVVFVSCDFSGSVDGDLYRIFAEPSGTYSYTTVLGAQSTVQAFSCYHVSHIKKP